VKDDVVAAGYIDVCKFEEDGHLISRIEAIDTCRTREA
jgi:hypothetical protein